MKGHNCRLEDFLIEMPPATVEHLDGLTDDACACYEPTDGGGYRLKDTARAAVEATNEELRRLWSENERGLAERDAKLLAKDAEIERLAKHTALANATVAIPPHLRKAAVAVLAEELQLGVMVDEGGLVTVTAMTPFGPQTVPEAVAGWLETEAGEPFAPAKPAAEGPFMRRLRTLH